VLALIALLYIAGLSWLQRLGNIDAPARFLVSSPGRPMTGTGVPNPSHPRARR
jgi:hypothetical protein